MIPRILLLLLLALPSFGAVNTYYIDLVGGNDANNGTSTSTPWKRHPYMAGEQVTYTHANGDRFIFKGGVTWGYTNFPINCLAGGTLATPDYYGYDVTWFTGGAFAKPIFDGGSSPHAINSFINTDNNLIIDGFQMENFYWLSGWNTSYIDVGGGTNVVVINCQFHKWDHGSGADDLIVVKGNPSATGVNPFAYISNCVFDGSQDVSGGLGSGMAVYCQPRILSCRVTNMSNGLNHNGMPAEIAYNTIGPILPSYTSTYHGNNIQQVGQSGLVKIHHNELFSAGGGIMIFVGNPGGPAYVYDNLIYDSTAIEVQCDGRAGASHLTVFNNTFISNFDDRGVVRNETGSLWTITNRNNHVIRGTITGTPNSVNSSNLTQSTAVASAAGYTSGNKWKPTSSSSSTVGGGVDLSGLSSSLPNIAKDLLLVTRPQGAAWDIGAYEFVTDSVAPSITSSTNATAANGTAFSYQIAVSGGATAYAISNAPAWLSVDQSSGLLSGTPNEASPPVTKIVGLLATNAIGVAHTNLFIAVSAAAAVLAVIVTNSSFGEIPTNTTIDVTLVVSNSAAASTTLTGYATNISTPWSPVGNTNYALAGGSATNIVLRYTPTARGENNGTIEFTGGGGSTNTLTGAAGNVHTTLTGIKATNELFRFPFAATADYVSQGLQTTRPEDGGRLVLWFSLSSGGTLTLSNAVDCPSAASDSFFVQIDSDPTTPTNIWDVIPTPTSGFENRFVGWRGGNGAFDSPEFPLVTFSLGAGLHKVVIVGREADALIRHIAATFTASGEPTRKSGLRGLRLKKL